MPHDHRIQHSELFKGKLILTQLTNALVGIEETLPNVGSKSPPDLHKGGFTTTVRANQAVTVAAINLTEMFSNNGLLPNCMVTLLETNTGVS